MKRGFKLLILSDLLIIMAFGLISPILAIFIKEDLIGGSAFAAGLSISIYLFTRAVFGIPFGRVEDHHAKKRFLLIGTYLIAIAPLGYYFLNNIYQLYLVQFMYGFGAAMAFPAFGALFIHYMDHGKEAYEWSVYGTVIGLGTAVTALVGGAIVQRFGFNYLFLATFIICMIGSTVLVFIPPEHFKNKIRK